MSFINTQLYEPSYWRHKYNMVIKNTHQKDISYNKIEFVLKVLATSLKSLVCNTIGGSIPFEEKKTFFWSLIVYVFALKIYDIKICQSLWLISVKLR